MAVAVGASVMDDGRAVGVSGHCLRAHPLGRNLLGLTHRRPDGVVLLLVLVNHAPRRSEDVQPDEPRQHANPEDAAQNVRDLIDKQPLPSVYCGVDLASYEAPHHRDTPADENELLADHNGYPDNQEDACKTHVLLGEPGILVPPDPCKHHHGREARQTPARQNSHALQIACIGPDDGHEQPNVGGHWSLPGQHVEQADEPEIAAQHMLCSAFARHTLQIPVAPLHASPEVTVEMRTPDQ
eukprot:3371311-Rhodomonas_salina.2